MFFKKLSAKKEINFSNPFNGRKWLNLLQVDSELGITFKKNLNIKKEKLGFSFSSNELGFRGKANINSDTVICGTSFAMGLSVDNNCNWYEMSDKLLESFNIGMPVGFINYNNALNSLYKGNYNTLIYLYHPNQFPISINYSKAYKLKKSIFQLMKWKTDIKSVVKLFIKWKIINIIKLISSKESYYLYKNKFLLYNTKYNFLDFDLNKENIDSEIIESKKLFTKFNNVYIFKIPIKEEILLKYISDNDLKKLKINYDERWNYFKEHLNDYTIFDDLDQYFNLTDYLPEDTHWSEQGNKTFLKYIKKSINA